MGRTDVDTVADDELIPSPSSPPEHFDASPFDEPWAFRAERLAQITWIPDVVSAECRRDMAPPQMDDLAESLSRELERARGDDSVTVEDADVETVQEAVTWLEYWAGKDYWVYASW